MGSAGFCITMFNEHNIVMRNLNTIRNTYGEKAHCIVVHSDDGQPLGSIKTVADQVFVFPNLALELPKHKIPSYSLSRNYGKAFTELYNTGIEFDYIVALCGDTLIHDVGNFDRRYMDMQKDGKLACVTQAIGQNFHAPDSDPANGVCGGRFQSEDITDIMPQFFMIDGRVAAATKAFAEIPVVNPYTSEHCLGDELVRMVGSFKDKVIVLSQSPYSYGDGIAYQQG